MTIQQQIAQLMEQRNAAIARRDWAAMDEITEQIGQLNDRRKAIK